MARRQSKNPSCEDGVASACEFLEHYHLQHTNDKVTHFHAHNRDSDIYIVSDEEARKKFKILFLEALATTEVIN